MIYLEKKKSKWTAKNTNLMTTDGKTHWKKEEKNRKNEKNNKEHKEEKVNTKTIDLCIQCHRA